MHGPWNKDCTSLKIQGLVLLCLAIGVEFFYKPVLATHSSDALKRAFKLEEKNPLEAQNLLETLKPEDSLFQPAVEEILKTSYRLNDWPRFFAYAQYYRNKWPVAKRAHVQFLEILALLRHCQNDLVFELTQFYRKNLPHEKELMDQMEALTRTRFQGKKTEGNSLSNFQMHLEGTVLKKTKNSDILRHSPRQLKIKVENLCSHS